MPRHAILITLDRLAARQIGAYGQFVTQTPALDHLAARSLVFHNAFTNAVPSPAVHSDEPAHPGQSFAQMIDAIEADLLPRYVVRQTLQQAPREWVLSGVAAIRHQLSSSEPGLTWIRGQGIPSPWIPDHSGWEAEVARLLGTSWRELLSDELPTMTPESAVRELADKGAFQRDEICHETTSDAAVDRLSLALYAACVQKLDDRLGRLIREYQRHAHDDSLLIVAGLLGDTLPRQLPVTRLTQLHSELVQVPLIMQVGTGQSGGSTLLDLVQTTDIPGTITCWCGKHDTPLAVSDGVPSDSAIDLLAVANGLISGHPRIKVSSQSGETLLRTQQGQLVIAPAATNVPHAEPTEWMTLKPEDAWDLLNVTDQYLPLRKSFEGQDDIE